MPAVILTYSVKQKLQRKALSFMLIIKALIANCAMLARHSRGFIGAVIRHNADRDIFQRDLERELSLAKSTITCILKPMEQKGYIERVSVASDARLKKLVVTEKGREMHHICYDNMLQMEKTLRNGLTEEELQTFFTIMGKMKDNVEQLSCQIKSEERKDDTK